MAEANKSGILAKAQKRLSRTKTKVLQTLGKADKSSDESFDELVQKTEKQHDVAHHLQKEFKGYLHCMRALCTASKSLAAALSQTYEEEWTDEDDFKKSLQCEEMLWNTYLDNMQSTVMESLNAYIASFPALKTKIAKRGRKMVDFDNSRHNLEVLQVAKKRDEAKIAKAQEDLNESKRIFEDLHNELCAELPDFYNSRVTFYAELFQKFFGCENGLHTEIGKVSQSMSDTAQRLSKDFVHFVYTPKRPLSKSPSDNSEDQHVNGDSSPRGGTDSPASSASPAATPTTPSAVIRPNAGSAAAVATPTAAAASAAAKEPEEAEEAAEDHLYGNQDAVIAAAKVNGDTDKIQEILGQQEEDETPASIDTTDPVSQHPVTTTDTSVAEYSAPTSAMATPNAADYDVPSGLRAVSLNETYHLVSSAVLIAPVSSDSNALSCLLPPTSCCSPQVPVVAQPTLASPSPGIMCQPLPSVTTGQTNLLEQVQEALPETPVECSGDSVRIPTGTVTEICQDYDDEKCPDNDVMEFIERKPKKESAGIVESSAEKGGEKCHSPMETKGFDVKSTGKVIDSSQETNDGNSAVESTVKWSEAAGVEISGKLDNRTEINGLGKEMTCTDGTMKGDVHSSTVDPHSTLSAAHSGDFIDSCFEQEMNNALLEGLTDFQEIEATQAGNPPSLSTQSSCLSFSTEDCEEAMLFLDKASAAETEFDTDAIDPKCSVFSSSACISGAETPLSHKNSATSGCDSKPASTVSDFSPHPTSRKQHDSEQLDELKQMSVTSEFETYGEAVGGKQNCEHFDESRPESNNSEFETFGAASLKKKDRKKDQIQSIERTYKSASSEPRPLSAVSDFETLDIVSIGKETQERELDDKMTHPEQQLDFLNLHEHSLVKCTETKTEGNIPATGNKVMNVWDTVPSIPSAAAQTTSSFSDFPKGEIHQTITSFSEEDLVSADRSRGSLETSNLTTSLGTSLESCGSIPAEEKSIISALEKAIMEETSTDTMSECSELGGSKPLMGEEHKSGGCALIDSSEMPVATNCLEESTDTDVPHKPDNSGYKITDEVCDKLYKTWTSQTTSIKHSDHSVPPEDIHSQKSSVHARNKSSISLPHGNLCVRGEGDPLQVMAIPHHSLPGQKGTEQEVSKEGAEKSKPSLTHRGIQMFKSMLHITSRGEKNIRALKTVDFDDSQKDSGNESEGRRKRNVCSPQKMVSPDIGTKGSKRKSSPSSHTHSPTPGNMKKEKKSDGLAKTPNNTHRVKSSTLPRKEELSDAPLTKILVSGKKDKSKDNLRTRRKSDTLPKTKDFVKKEKSDMQTIVLDNTEKGKNSEDQLKKECHKSRDGSNIHSSPNKSKSENIEGTGNCVAGGIQRTPMNSNEDTSHASERGTSSDISAGYFSRDTYRESSTAQTGYQQPLSSLKASVGVLDLNHDTASIRQLQAAHTSLSHPISRSGIVQPTMSNMPHLTPESNASMPVTESNKAGQLPYECPGQREGSGAEPRSSKKTLNPLAPPFTMPSSPARPLPGPISEFPPVYPTTGPGDAAPTQLRPATPHSQTRSPGDRSSKSQQWHHLSMPFTEARIHVKDCSQITCQPASTMPAVSRMPVVTGVNRSALGGRRSLPAALHPEYRETSRHSVSQPPVRSALPQSTYLAAPYSYLHADLEVPAFQHGGDVVIGTQPVLMSSLQGSLMKEEVGNQSLANSSVVGLHGETEKASENGEGDVCVKQVTPPAEAKELVVVESTNIAGPQISSKLSENKVTQKPAHAVTSPAITTDTAAVLSHDLDLAREAWRKAWRTSNMVDTESSENSMAVEEKGDAEATCDNIQGQNQESMEDSGTNLHEIHTNLFGEVSAVQRVSASQVMKSKPDVPDEYLKAKNPGDSTESESQMQVMSSAMREINPAHETEASAECTLQCGSLQGEYSAEDVLLDAERTGPSAGRGIRHIEHKEDSLKSTESTVGSGAVVNVLKTTSISDGMNSKNVCPQESSHISSSGDDGIGEQYLTTSDNLHAAETCSTCIPHESEDFALPEIIHEECRIKVHFIERSYHVSDGFETLKDDMPDSNQASIGFDTLTDDICESQQVNNELKMQADKSTTDGEKETHVNNSAKTDTTTSESDKYGSQSSGGVISQKENVEEPEICAGLPEAEIQRNPEAIVDVTSTAVRQASSELNRPTLTTEANSVDATACDSAITADWETYYSGQEAMSLCQQQAETTTSNEVVTACDSGISTSEISHSITDVDIEVSQSRTSMINHAEGVSSSITDTLSMATLSDHHDGLDSTGEFKLQGQQGIESDVDLQYHQQVEEKSGELNEEDGMSEGCMYNANQSVPEQKDNDLTYEEEEIGLEQMLTDQETNSELSHEKLSGLEQTDQEQGFALEEIPIEKSFTLDQTLEKQENGPGLTNEVLETSPEQISIPLESSQEQTLQEHETVLKQHSVVQIASELKDKESTVVDQMEAENRVEEQVDADKEQKDVEKRVEQTNTEDTRIEQMVVEKTILGQMNAGKPVKEQLDADKTMLEEEDSVIEQMDEEEMFTKQVNVQKTVVEQTCSGKMSEEEKFVTDVEETDLEKKVMTKILEETVVEQKESRKKEVAEQKYEMKINELEVEQKDDDRDDAEQTCTELVPRNPAEPVPVVKYHKEPAIMAGNFDLLRPDITLDTSVTFNGKAFSSVRTYVKCTVQVAAKTLYSSSKKDGAGNPGEPQDNVKLLKPDMTINPSASVDGQVFPSEKSLVEHTVQTAVGVSCHLSMKEGSTDTGQPEEESINIMKETAERNVSLESVKENKDKDSVQQDESVISPKRWENTVTEDTKIHSSSDLVEDKTESKQEMDGFQCKIPHHSYLQDNIVPVEQPLTEDVGGLAGDKLEPESKTVAEDEANFIGSELGHTLEMNTNSSAIVTAMHNLDADFISSQDPAAFDCEGFDSFEVMFCKGDTIANIRGCRENDAACDWVECLESNQQMNALSSAKPEASAESGPAAASNNVYEEPQGNGEEESEEEDEEDGLYQSPPSNKPVVEAPPDTLYQVEATNLYAGEEIDELSFEPGEIIYVVPFDNDEEQDEGWQMGIKQKDGMKGVFPENFTRKL